MERKSCCGSSYSSCGSTSTPKMQTTPVQGNVSKKEEFVKPKVITKNEAAKRLPYRPANYKAYKPAKGLPSRPANYKTFKPAKGFASEPAKGFASKPAVMETPKTEEVSVKTVELVKVNVAK